MDKESNKVLVDFYKCAEPDYEDGVVSSVEVDIGKLDAMAKEWFNHDDGYYYLVILDNIFDEIPVESKLIDIIKNRTRNSDYICQDCGGHGHKTKCPYNASLGVDVDVVLCSPCEKERKFCL